MPIATASSQQTWEAHVITTNPSSARAQRTAQSLRAIGIDVTFEKAVPAASSSLNDKVRSHTMTSRNAFDAIARQSGPPDDYVLMFEDDVALAPGIAAEHVRGLLACAARKSLRATGGPLPLFYTGGCWPKFTTNQTFWGNYTPIPRVAGGLATERMTCRCAHAYAVRRGDARVLWRLAQEQPDRVAQDERGSSLPGFYMDVQLDFLSRERGGVYLLGANVLSPEDSYNRGLWYQDRTTFRSGIGRPVMLSFVAHSGWADQLAAVAHALSLAQKIGRALVVPRALSSHDVKNGNGCFAQATKQLPSTRVLVDRYDMFSHRPMLDEFIDTSVWPVVAFAPTDAASFVNSSRYFVPNMCSFEESTTHHGLGKERINAGPTWKEGLLPQLLSAHAKTFSVVQLGSAQTLYAEPNCDFCFVRYRPELLQRASRLLCTASHMTCTDDRATTPTYDAIHLRLSPPYPRTYNATAVLRLALLKNSRFNAKSTHSAPRVEPPLYVSSDDLTNALRLVTELNADIGRQILSMRDLDRAESAKLLRTKATQKTKHGHLRSHLTDAMISLGSRRFTHSAGIFSGHILGMRACAAAATSKQRQMACPARLRRYDFSNHCVSADSCDLPRIEYAT